jgi:hypothetical protein
MERKWPKTVQKTAKLPQQLHPNYGHERFITTLLNILSHDFQTVTSQCFCF